MPLLALMPCELVPPIELLGKVLVIAFVWLLHTMTPPMIISIAACRKYLAADLTWEKFFTPVHSQMLKEITFLVEFSAAHFSSSLVYPIADVLGL